MFILQSLLTLPLLFKIHQITHALQSHSPPRVSSQMSPPYTTPPLSPSMALKKQDAIMDKPSTDTKTAVEKFYGSLNIYKTMKPLEDLAVLGMSVKEF
jgi:hypothetical protein